MQRRGDWEAVIAEALQGGLTGELLVEALKEQEGDWMLAQQITVQQAGLLCYRVLKDIAFVTVRKQQRKLAWQVSLAGLDKCAMCLPADADCVARQV